LKAAVTMTSLGEKRLRKELAVLFVILSALAVLSVRPFGFRHFLRGIGNNELFSILIVMGMVGVSLVILQRVGIIFPDTDARELEK
jgi:hypothetical protein